MRDYGKVFTCIWASESFRSMSEDGRALGLYLLTCPHGTIAGVFRLPDGYAVDDLQWSSERVSEGFRELSENGFATRCERTKWVWVHRHLEWNPPENPNQRKSALKQALQVPEQCSWRGGFIRQWGPSLGVDNQPQDNGSQTIDEGLPNQYQEQKQEQEQEQKEEKASRKRSAATPPAPEDVDVQVWDDWGKLRKAKKAPVTDTVIASARTEAGKAGIPFEAFLRLWCLRGSQGLMADWLRPEEIRQAKGLQNKADAQLARNKAAAAEWAAAGAQDA